MKNVLLILLPFVFIACVKNEKINQETLIATWRLEATKYSDSLNTGTWVNTNFEKQVNSFDLYCVYDANVNQSFLSMLNCAYDNTPTSSIGIVSSGCGRSVIARDTTWYQLLKYDITFTSTGSFNWIILEGLSKHLNLINQPCSSRTYIPESNNQHDSPGKWTFDEAAQIITLDYSPDWSIIDGQQINQFQVISYSGDELVVKHIATNGGEYRLRKL